MLKVISRPSLTKLGRQYGTDKAMPHHNYTPHYERLFDEWRFRSDLTLLEIGIDRGGSIRMWRDFFPHAAIHCFDHNPWCVGGVSDVSGVHAHCLDAANPAHLAQFFKATGHPKFDIIIDDGSHLPEHQWASFLGLKDSLKKDAYYIVEDMDAPYGFRDGRHQFIDNLAGLISKHLMEDTRLPFDITFTHHLVVIKKGLR